LVQVTMARRVITAPRPRWPIRISCFMVPPLFGEREVSGTAEPLIIRCLPA
jgi:hypothetical protein